MSLRWRVALISAAAAVIGIVLGLSVSAAVDRSNRAIHELNERWSPANVDANALLAHLVDQESGERGYLITGDQSYLQPYDAGEQAAGTDLTTLRVLLRGDRAAVRRLDGVEHDIDAWRSLAAQPEIAARNQSAAAAQALAAQGTGKALFDALRTDVGELQKLIDKRRDVAQQEVVSANGSLSHLLWLTAVVSLVVGLGVFAGLVMWVLRPLGRLSAAMGRVSDGDLDAPVVVTGPAEIAKASADAEHMRRRILAELERSEASRQALEQRGPVVLALSQQLASRGSEPVAGIRYAVQLRPAEGLLAGDWVDIVPIGNDRVALMLLDVSGHGAAAGLEAMRLKTVLTTAVCLGRPPHEALALAASGFTEDERFATAVVAILDTATGQIRWANAGHLSPRIVPMDERVLDADDLQMLPPTGPLLSNLTSGWTTKTMRLEVGQMLLAFSDGLTEARDNSGREFGIDGMCAALSQATVRDVDTAVTACLAAVRAHSVNVHRDDITLLAVSLDPSTMPTRDVAPATKASSRTRR